MNKNESWVDAYLDDEDFWIQAIKNKSVDVIYRPDATLGKDYLQVDHFVNHAIIWEGVKVIETRFSNVNGRMRFINRFEPETEAERIQYAQDLAPTPGKLLIDP